MRYPTGSFGLGRIPSSPEVPRPDPSPKRPALAWPRLGEPGRRSQLLGRTTRPRRPSSSNAHPTRWARPSPRSTRSCSRLATRPPRRRPDRSAPKRYAGARITTPTRRSKSPSNVALGSEPSTRGQVSLQCRFRAGAPWQCPWAIRARYDRTSGSGAAEREGG